jgi:ribosome-associated translation inhibitor RaiA
VRIDVTGAGVTLTKTLREDVRRRILIAMSRPGPAVRAVSVRLAESPNPLGGVDQSCTARARLQSGRVLSAEAIDGRIETAVSRCAAHLALLVVEAIAGGRRPPLPLRGRRPE